MTKEDKIKEAWGEYYEQIKNELDEHGRYSYSDQNTNERKRKMWQFENIECHQIYDLELLIPSSIKGIENNNGWNACMNESPQPTESGMYWVIIHHLGKIFLDTRFYNSTTNEWDGYPNVSHWQLLNRPENPVY
ncbi:hypothetical protein [Chryseobacterium sediminis]|uniref:DUF551 domain-containing protein n=1 Tax=Chryseobacterium sediminis TaxID=1679494 RepID=A0A5B2U8Y7_9FLAO|nr:hypothetical protein [Chryseobacterium sediminis]KAA2222999.1 hypothetical protein FW780_02005 [Chryseobacterium sediminis]